MEVALKEDPVLDIVLGHMADEVSGVQLSKVFELVAPARAEAPYVVWQIVPGSEPSGHYGDMNAIENQNVQITSWGRTNDEAWRIFEVVREAIEGSRQIMDVEAIPYDVLKAQLTGDQFALPDQDTNYIQVPSTWRIVLSR